MKNNQRKDEGYHLFLEIFPFDVKKDNYIFDSRDSHESRFIRKVNIKEIRKRDIIRDNPDRDDDFFEIEIEMVDGLIYRELFEAGDLQSRGLIPDDCYHHITFSKEKRDARYEEISNLITEVI